MATTAAVTATVDSLLKDWRQGDVVLGDIFPFVHLANFSRPITDNARAAAENEGFEGADPIGTVFVNAAGAVIITQSCDLVRSCRDQPFVKLAALMQVEEGFLSEVTKGMRPRYLHVPGVADQSLVASLDAITTVEKAIVADITPELRIRGCRTDFEVREFAFALSRNLSRFAFPDDFSAAVRPIQKRILEKHGKSTRDSKGRPTSEGRALVALREIRVGCSPSWGAPEPKLMFYFIFNNRSQIPANCDRDFELLVKRFKPTGAFAAAEFQVVALSEMSAEAYISSDPLDLDYLSH